MSPVRPRPGFGRRFGYFMLAATAVWFALVGAIVVAYGWEELQGIGYFVGLLAFVALMGDLGLVELKGRPGFSARASG